MLQQPLLLTPLLSAQETATSNKEHPRVRDCLPASPARLEGRRKGEREARVSRSLQPLTAQLTRSLLHLSSCDLHVSREKEEGERKRGTRSANQRLPSSATPLAMSRPPAPQLQPPQPPSSRPASWRHHYITSCSKTHRLTRRSTGSAYKRCLLSAKSGTNLCRRHTECHTPFTPSLASARFNFCLQRRQPKPVLRMTVLTRDCDSDSSSNP